MEVQGAIGWTRYAAFMDLPVEVIEDSETKRIAPSPTIGCSGFNYAMELATHDCGLAYHACFTCR